MTAVTTASLRLELHTYVKGLGWIDVSTLWSSLCFLFMYAQAWCLQHCCLHCPFIHPNIWRCCHHTFIHVRLVLVAVMNCQLSYPSWTSSTLMICDTAEAKWVEHSCGKFQELAPLCDVTVYDGQCCGQREVGWDSSPAAFAFKSRLRRSHEYRTRAPLNPQRETPNCQSWCWTNRLWKRTPTIWKPAKSNENELKAI